jgi:hypothetical protein
MRMIQRMPMPVSSLPLLVVDLAELISAEEQRETGRNRYAVAISVTEVALQKIACTGQ